ncbi:class I SAM-dependent methyltransferase [Salisediminibacterium halotolerans]|uniref:16S rRNA (Guanine1207-N2)-methyltransferase n=1 Tax=Salisediminibacterium halotolerans TaxID=517425 RepID=A0A1H9URF0_9BACI|nr:methyltransferase [Salisediminibacterium haloalkalitolerans]SES11637.1 16S rRNA (guanine1207-N2)-methyltransferase [Salisediminibacterium haloalkalitolerans]
MSDHYYSHNPDIDSKRREIRVSLREQPFSFVLDRGVFASAGLDFGTQVLIEAFEEPPVDGPMLDIGCGWGPIGISLAVFYPERDWVMLDVNQRSADLARENAVKNSADNCEILCQDIRDFPANRTFAAAVTNPPVRAGKDTVFAIYEKAYELLGRGGELWVVIQKKQGAPSTENKLKELGFSVTLAAKKKGYQIFRATRID